MSKTAEQYRGERCGMSPEQLNTLTYVTTSLDDSLIAREQFKDVARVMYRRIVTLEDQLAAALAKLNTV